MRKFFISGIAILTTSVFGQTYLPQYSADTSNAVEAQLRKELTSARDTIQLAVQQVSYYKAQLADLQTKLDGTSRTESELRARIQKQEYDIQRLNSDKAALAQDFTNKLAAVRTELNTAKNQLDSAAKRSYSDYQSGQEAKRELNRIAAEKLRLEQRIVDLNNQYVALEKELQTVRAENIKMQGREKEYAAQREKVATITANVKTLQQSMVAFRNDYLRLKQEANELRLAKNAAESKLATMESVVANGKNMENMLAEAKSKLDTVENDKLQLERDFLTAKSDLTRNLAENSNLKETIYKLETKTKALEQQLADSAAANQAEVAAKDKAVNESKGLSEQLKALQSATSSKSTKVTDLEKKLNALNATIADKDKKIAEYQGLRDTNKKLSDDLQKFQKESADKLAKVEAELVAAREENIKNEKALREANLKNTETSEKLAIVSDKLKEAESLEKKLSDAENSNREQAELLKDADAVKKLLKEASDGKAQAETTIKLLKEEIDSLTKQREALTSQNLDMLSHKERVQEIGMRNEELAQTIDTKDKLIAEMKATAENLEKQVASGKDEYAVLLEKYTKLESDSKSQAEKSKTTSGALSSEISKLKEEVDAKSIQLAEMQDVKGQLAALTAKNEELKNALDVSAKEVEQLKNSANVSGVTLSDVKSAKAQVEAKYKALQDKYEVLNEKFRELAAANTKQLQLKDTTISDLQKEVQELEKSIKAAPEEKAKPKEAEVPAEASAEAEVEDGKPSARRKNVYIYRMFEGD